MKTKKKKPSKSISSKPQVGHTGRSDKEIFDDDMLEATKRLASLEKDLWCVILGNPSKVRFPLMCIQDFLKTDQRYKPSKELNTLLSRTCKQRAAGGPKSRYWQMMDKLIDELLRIDLDREIVTIAKKEAINHGLRNKSNLETVLSSHAQSIEEAASQVESA